MRRKWIGARTAVVCAFAAMVATGGTFGREPERAPLASTPHFVFYSDFATNLNDALIAAGVARNQKRAELFRSGDEEACFDGLPPSVRAGWDRAVDYYAEIISPTEWLERQQYLLRVDLAGMDDFANDREAQRFVAIARAFREAAAPAYEACRWPVQDAENRSWIERLQAPLAAHEQGIGARLEQLYGRPWRGLPFVVDVVETVNWARANSIFPGSAGGHLLVSNSYQGPAALEVVFHEASHQLMLRGNPVPQALADAAERLGTELPRDLWHVVLFYTTGEMVRRSLDAAGEPGYTPLLDDIIQRNERWRSYGKALGRAWEPYIGGRRPLEQAARDLVRALPAPD